jgi:hypothetical protein
VSADALRVCMVCAAGAGFASSMTKTMSKLGSSLFS